MLIYVWSLWTLYRVCTVLQTRLCSFTTTLHFPSGSFKSQLQAVLTTYYEDIKGVQGGSGCHNRRRRRRGVVSASGCTKPKVVKRKFEDQDDADANAADVNAAADADAADADANAATPSTPGPPVGGAAPAPGGEGLPPAPSPGGKSGKAARRTAGGKKAAGKA
jgi:hypothetical protein